MNAVQLDRAVGVVLASAAGDALGSQYEFGPALADDVTPQFGRGVFGHEIGEWTDDTSMAMPILQVPADGRTLEDTTALDEIVARWCEWSLTAKDVGIQTRGILSSLTSTTADAASAASERAHRATGRSAGNGSLMRTGPVALGYLDRSPAELAAAAGRVAQLTHWEDDNVVACALWCLAIRHAVLTGELDMHGALRSWSEGSESKRDDETTTRWRTLINQALVPTAHPRDFREHNGWVVRAFQAALTAVAGSTSLTDAVERAIRGGGDTDTVAAIAGALAGAVYGGTAVPLRWKRMLHGWPGLDADDLTRLAVSAARHGRDDTNGWPSAGRVPVSREVLVRHPHDPHVLIGSIAALDDLPGEVDAVVSLCRVGTAQVPARCESVQVWLVDQPDRNANLDFVLTEAADVIATFRMEGKTVFVHCFEARSRTAAVAALYGARHRGVPLAQAWDDVHAALPESAAQEFLRDAVARIVEEGTSASGAKDADPARM
jgi:ADP-ribosylglycohydrolase